MDTVDEAIQSHNVPTIFHSDRGLCFVSEEFSNYLEQAGIKQSVANKEAVKWGNQVCERFHSKTKGETCNESQVKLK